jgi:RND family efflux transporter MFP subunit
VSAKTTGKVAEVLVEEGTTVTEGQLLARLDSSTILPVHSLAERQLASARIKLQENQVRISEAERTLRRTEKLRAEKLVSESQLDTAQSEVAALRARMAALRSDVEVAEGTVKVRSQELEDLLVRAPFSGVVISKDAQPGEMISPVSAGGGFTRTGIATIVDMDSREIELDVNESFINRVKTNQKTEAVLDAYPDWRIPSHVINIVPAADRQKATVKVRVAFDQLDPRILTDMGVKVSFLEDSTPQTAQRRAVKIPSSAIVTDGEKRYVWRVNDGKAERIAIRVGAQRDGESEVLAGVSSSDLLIAEPAPQLVNGSRVEIKQD